MSRFTDNVNYYLSQMKIKQSYISLVTGIEKNKLSRILKGNQDASGTDMEQIADALGRSVDFFWKDTVEIPESIPALPEQIAFYAGNPTEEQEKVAGQLLELVKNVDAVLGAKLAVLNLLQE
ncbi:MAG: helix-turn-helix domain-containing protein [Clostridiales bacterium]|nr:helix-turn-helix domain-containing protein [Clostridiales bacterium]